MTLENFLKNPNFQEALLEWFCCLNPPAEKTQTLSEYFRSQDFFKMILLMLF